MKGLPFGLSAMKGLPFGLSAMTGLPFGLSAMTGLYKLDGAEDIEEGDCWGISSGCDNWRRRRTMNEPYDNFTQSIRKPEGKSD